MVGHPRDYPWSSYRANGEDKADRLVRPHALYRSLASEESRRRLAYRELVKAPKDTEHLGEIRDCTNKGWALGSGRFKARIERLAARRATPLPKGRPGKVAGGH
jgi:putative transposase